MSIMYNTKNKKEYKMKYLHGSRKLFARDFILLPQQDGYVYHDESIEFEKYVESRRPQNKLSRFKSVYLSENADNIDGAGGYIDAIYEVKPLSIPEPSDLSWYTEAYIEFESMNCGGKFQIDRLNLMIDNYWSGEPYPKKENSNIEYRVASAMVVRMLELNVEISELEVVRDNRGKGLSV